MKDLHHAHVLVIGASAAGLKCAARLRRLRPDLTVVVVDASSEVSVGACGLPYVISGDIDEPDALRKTAFGVMRDEAFFERYKGVRVLTGVRAERVDAAQRVVTVVRLATGDRGTIAYDELVVATGAVPFLPAGCASGTNRVRVVKTLQDARALRQALESGSVSRAGIVGAGFIGCEMAEALGGMWGCEVTMLEAADQVLPGLLDPEMAALVLGHLREQGVDVRTGVCVHGIEEREDGVAVATGDATLLFDEVVVAAGAIPATGLAAQAGVALGARGGIRVDATMATSVPHIWAAGDCVEVVRVVDGAALPMPLGSLANRQGRVVADCIAGVTSRFGPVAGSFAVKVFELQVAATGLRRKDAQAAGLNVQTVWGCFGDRAHYYPDDARVFFELVFERGTERLIGLQGVGRGDVLRRVDVFATLLLRGARLEDMLELEFAYAPPYAGALDPLHYLASMGIAQEREGLVAVGPGEGIGDALVLDVRLTEESEAAPVPGPQVLCIPMAELAERMGELPAGDVVVMCEKGPRSLEVARRLRSSGMMGVRYAAGGRSFRQGDLG